MTPSDRPLSADLETLQAWLRDAQEHIESGVATDLVAVCPVALRRYVEELIDARKRLGGINSLACYASEEDTDSQPFMLQKIGRVARGEEEVTWPII